MQRLVLDTNVILTALLSPEGASAALLRLARTQHVILLANVALALEYEAVCLRQENILRSQLSRTEVLLFIDAVIAMCEPVKTQFLWRPQLNDPNDEFVLEAAVNGQAQAIVTFNKRDFVEIERRFNLNILTPTETLKGLRS